MKPLHRHLLITGLLVALLVVVVIGSLARRAEAAEADAQQVSTISDSRITESSGLVVSRVDADLAYTINDSGNDPVIFAIRISTGAVVGTTDLQGDGFEDIEALSMDPAGNLWVADTGDNDTQRDDIALYSLPEQGEGDHSVRPARYPLTYPDGRRNVEALAINPRTGAKLLLSKGALGGDIYRVPDDLKSGQANRVEQLDGSVAGLITDASFTNDGRYVVARNYSTAYVLDPSTWSSAQSEVLPATEQGETLAMEPSGTSYVVGSEGEDSPLFRVAFTEPAAPGPSSGPTPSPVPTAASQEPPEGGNGFAGAQWFWSAVVVALLAAISYAATGKR